jgi:hypothetical protein
MWSSVLTLDSPEKGLLTLKHVGTHKYLLRTGMTLMVICTWTVYRPITVAALSKAWTVFARWKTGILNSNPTQCRDVCVRLFCVCDVLCAGSGLAMGCSPFYGALPTRNQETEKAVSVQQRAAEPLTYKRYYRISPLWLLSNYPLNSVLQRVKARQRKKKTISV